MSNTISTPASQPTDLVRRFEPARDAVAPKACDRRAGCWVVTGKTGRNGGGGVQCAACGDNVQLAGNEAKHAAVLRRCMASQNEVSP